jgi:hypothetical protein
MEKFWTVAEDILQHKEMITGLFLFGLALAGMAARWWRALRRERAAGLAVVRTIQEEHASAPEGSKRQDALQRLKEKIKANTEGTKLDAPIRRKVFQVKKEMGNGSKHE